MTRCARLLAVCFAAVIFAAACSNDGGSGAAGVDASTLMSSPYLTFDGESRTIGQIDGPIVVNFFASWCTPCITEMPDFEAVHQSLGDRVTVLGLNYDDSAAKGRELVERTAVTYPVGRDAKGVLFKATKGLQLPTTVFIRADGTVAKVHMMQLSEQKLRQTISDELGVDS